MVCSFVTNLHLEVLIVVKSPKDKKELFNLRHAQAQNIIERIFGVLKRRFRILLLAPEYNIEIQNCIPAALAALHNFIRIHDPQETIISEADLDDVYDSFSGFHAGDTASEQHQTAASLQCNELEIADGRHDGIANAMWNQYQQVLQEREHNNLLNVDSDDEDQGDCI